MARGGKRPGAGRPKGAPNKVTSEARALFNAMFDHLAPDVEAWIRKAAKGQLVKKTLKDGSEVKMRVNADPGKAADLAIRLAEFHYPKLARVEKTISDASEEELLAEVRKRKAEAEKAPERK